MCTLPCRFLECGFAWTDAKRQAQVRVRTGWRDGACGAVHRYRGKCRGCLDAACWEVLMGDGEPRQIDVVVLVVVLWGLE